MVDFLYICDNEHQVITTFTKDDIDYLFELLTGDLGDKGFWYSNEESTFDTIDLLKDYFNKKKN